MKHILATETINKVLSYLAGKAFSEVSELIAEVKAKAVLFEDPAATTPPIAPVTPDAPVAPAAVVKK